MFIDRHVKRTQLRKKERNGARVVKLNMSPAPSYGAGGVVMRDL
jgi:hypothetical protein